MAAISQRFLQQRSIALTLQTSGVLMGNLGAKIVEMGIGKFNEVSRLVTANFTHGFNATYAELNNGIASGLKSVFLSEAEAAEFTARSASGENLEVLGRTIEFLGTLTKFVGFGLFAYASYKARRDIHRLMANPPPAAVANPYQLPDMLIYDTSDGG